MTKLISISGLLLAMVSSQVHAHLYLENPNCRGPQKPLQFVTEVDKQEFDEKVAKFRQCLENFVARQNKAIEQHNQSASKAATLWEDYVVKVLEQKIKKAPTETTPADKVTPSPSSATEPNTP